MKKLTFLLFCLLIAGMQLIQAQGVVITGKAIDKATGDALPGVTVLVKGTTVGSTSLVDGTYRVTVPAGATTLVFSFIGYVTQEIEISGRNIIDVAMTEEALALQEVVVTGYSTEKKKDIIGSVAIVNTDQMLSTPSGSVSNQLQGRASGVSVSADGSAGGTARVRIRGIGTFTESEPLYIIDGTPGDINRLNPNDIASVQILKDAASSAVYGARAANGVMIITTKQGKQGSSKITVDTYYGSQYLGEKWYPKVLDATQWGELYWASLKGAGLSPGGAGFFHAQYGSGAEPVIPEFILVKDGSTKYGGADLEAMRTSNPALFSSLTDPANYNFATHQIVRSANTNWAQEMYDAAPIQSHQVTASGGGEKNTYLVSMNYFDQGSIATEMTYFKRYTARANTTLSIRDRIRIGENIQVMYSKQRNLDYNQNAWTYHPLIPMTDIAGNIAGSSAPNLVMYGNTPGMNPVLSPVKEKSDYNKKVGMFGNVFLELDIVKNLTFRSSFGFDFGYNERKDFFPFYTENAEPTTPIPDRLLYANNFTENLVWTNTANYSITSGNHVAKIMLGTEAVRNQLNTFAMERQNYALDYHTDDNFLVLDAGTGSQTNGGTTELTGLLSQFGRVDYTYADKYIFNATVRRDGSSKFGKENRYGIFPSAAIGWRISAEPFMQGLTWLSDMKLKASTGVIGNQTGLTPNNQYSLYVSQDRYSYPIQGGNTSRYNSYILNSIGNINAKWEKTGTTNVGLDASILDGRISFAGEYYIRKTTDLLVVNQAPTTGSEAIQPYVNVGAMTNKGVDLTLSYRGLMLGELEYELSANFSKYKNNVTKVLDNPAATITVAGTGQNINYSRTIVGLPIAHFYGYKIDGFFNTQEEVDAYKASYTTYLTPRLGGWRIQDISGPAGVPDNVVNDFDRTIIGSPHPDFQANFSLSLNYKGFDLFANAFWNQGGDLWNTMRYYVDFWSIVFNKSERMLYDSWTPENHNALLPAVSTADNTSYKYSNDYFVEDATYVRIRTIQLGYTLPASLTGKLRVDNLRVYVQSQNPFTWCKEFSGMDPDAGFSTGSDLQIGTVSGNTPTPQQILLGASITF